MAASSEDDMEAEIMIIGTDKILATSPPHSTIAHFLNGENGQTATCIQRSPIDLRLMFDDAKARHKKFGPKLFLFAPFKDMPTDFLLSVAWPMVAEAFGIPPEEAVIFEHDGIARPNGGSGRHWHVAVNFADPITGKFRNWSWDRAKLERCSRVIELLRSEKILVGRFQGPVIRKLREMGEHIYADAIERANPADAQPAARTPKKRVEQPAKAQGIDLRKVDKEVRAAYKASADGKQFRAALSKMGFKLVAANRSQDQPAWSIHNANGFLRSLGGSLPRVSMNAINAKIGPENDGQQLDLIDHINAITNTASQIDAAAARGDERESDVVDARAGAGIGGDDPGHAGGLHQLATDPERYDCEQAALLFIEELRAAPDDRIKAMVDTAHRITRSPVKEILDYVEAKAGRARAYIARAAQDLPPVNEVLANIRKMRDQLVAKIKSHRMAWVESTITLGVLAMESRPPKANGIAYDKKIAKGYDIEREMGAKVAQAEEALKVYIEKNENFEMHHQAKIKEHRETVVASKLERANRFIRVASRISAMMNDDKGVRVGFLGAEGLFEYALAEDSKAGPEAKFRIAGPPPVVLQPRPLDDNEYPHPKI